MANNERKEPKLFGPGGQRISKEPLLVSIKSPVPIPQQVIEHIAKITGCAVIAIPMCAEMLTGKVAKDELDVIHDNIHKFLEEEEKKGTKEV